MVAGSCVCGQSAWEISGEPAAKAACHCNACQKTSGCSNSINLIIPREAFKLTRGTPKTFTRKGDSGKNVTYSFCSECPTIITVDAEAMGGPLIVKYGAIDDKAWLESVGKPGVEIYTKNRYTWQEPLSGVDQFEAAT